MLNNSLIEQTIDSMDSVPKAIAMLNGQFDDFTSDDLINFFLKISRNRCCPSCVC